MTVLCRLSEGMARQFLRWQLCKVSLLQRSWAQHCQNPSDSGIREIERSEASTLTDRCFSNESFLDLQDPESKNLCG